jgi:hypothetical protein
MGLKSFYLATAASNFEHLPYLHMDFYPRLKVGPFADISKQIELEAALACHWHQLAVKLVEKYHESQILLIGDSE